MSLPLSLRRLNNLSLRAKLLVGVTIIVGVMLLFGVYLFLRLLTINTSFVTLDEHYSRLRDVLVLEVDNKQLTGLVQTDVLKHDPKLEAQYNTKSLELDSALAKLKSASQDQQEKSALAKYEQITGKLKGTELLILSEVRGGDLVKARDLFDSNYESQQAAATQYLTNLVDNEGGVVSSSIATNHKQVEATQLWLTLTLLFLVFALALMVTFFGKDIVTAIAALNLAAAEFARGNLSARVTGNRKDEIGSLGNEFNDMATKIGESYDQLKQEKIRFLASINGLRVGFLMTFLDTRTITYNPALAEILHLTTTAPGNSTQLTLEAVQQKLTAYDLEAAIQRCQQTGQSFPHTQINYADRILNVTGAPILASDKTVLGTVILFDDITEAKIQERSKDEFFSIASHELRTPLTSIKGNSSMILDYYGEVLKDEKLREMVDDMHSSAVRLIEIVNDFLDVSRLEQGKMSFKYMPVSVEKVVEGVVYEMKSVVAERKIYLKIDRLTLDALPLVWADENRLKQVVYNLVGNAAKFTDDGGITISAELDPTKKFVKVLVTDTGRGMTHESQQLLFHKFQQASSSLLTRDTTRGTGLGLYISKMIIEMMGGEIALVKSLENKGTVFSFTVPVASSEQKVSLPIPALVTDSKTGLTSNDEG